MMITIGSARIDEHGKIAGGQPGDQTGGEVSTQEFYVHSKGWIILRATDRTHAEKIAAAMKTACTNIHIGYDQSHRLDIIKYGTRSSVDTSCDCSSLIRQCVIEATGIDPHNFNTAGEKAALLKTGLFDAIPFSSREDLRTGDILVTKTKGHTVIVTDAPERPAAVKSVSELDKAIEVVAKYVLRGAFGNGSVRKENLYITVQRKVNEISRR